MPENPRTTITVRQDLFQALEVRRARMGFTRSRYFEEVLDAHFAEIEEVPHEQQEELERRIEALDQGMEELARRINGLSEILEDSAERVAARLMDTQRATLTINEFLWKMFPQELEKIDRQEISRRVEEVMNTGESGRRN